MGDVFGNSTSGLLAFQRSLTVTSNNVTNASTKGYSRERVDLAENEAQGTASGFYGSGVKVASVTRDYSDFLAQQVRQSQSGYSSADTFSTQAERVDNMLSDTTTGLTASLQSFANALHTVADSPASTAQRQALLSNAQSLTTQLQNYSSQLDQFNSDVTQQIGDNVGQINTISANIAQLNLKIAASQAATGQTPNDLLDQRDTLIDQLSQYVSVNTAAVGDGQVNVYVGSGQALVVSGAASKLTAAPDPFDPSKVNVGLMTGDGKSVDITSEISGGSLGGLLSVRSQVLEPTQNALGRLAVGLTNIVNQAQARGIDLTGAPGKPMFAVGGVEVAPNVTNAGSGNLKITRTDLGALTTDNYKLTYTGGKYQLEDTTTSSLVSMSGSGSASNPFVAAGMSIVVTGSPSSNDSFEIRPTAAATAGMSVLLTRPDQIAAASPVTSAPSSSNKSTASIAPVRVVDTTDPQSTAPAKITFTSPTTYQINGKGNFQYTSGQPIKANGWSTTITGKPAQGDTFTIGSNASGTGDNSNLLSMIDDLSAKTLDGGTASLNSAANNLESQVGVTTQQAQNSAATQKSVNADAVDTRNNLSGVNLDEEAADLVKFQQAYQACAQMIQAANTMFNTLLTAIQHG